MEDPRLKYRAPLREGILLRRYQRFLADVVLPDGETVATWCPNPGSMKSCLSDRAPCRISSADNPRRKLQWTLEQVQVDGTWILVHTARANDVVAEAIGKGAVPELTGYPVLQRERRYGRNSRIDILLTDEKGRAAYVEVKNVTLLEDGEGFFPDAVSERGTKHLRELMAVVEGGDRGVLFFHVGRGDIPVVRPAAHIDPVYAETLAEAVERGVEVLAYRCAVRAEELVLGERLPVSVSGTGTGTGTGA
jgi:sugar fermentation stimulation protein A